MVLYFTLFIHFSIGLKNRWLLILLSINPIVWLIHIFINIGFNPTIISIICLTFLWNPYFRSIINNIIKTNYFRYLLYLLIYKTNYKNRKIVLKKLIKKSNEINSKNIPQILCESNVSFMSEINSIICLILSKTHLKVTTLKLSVLLLFSWVIIIEINKTLKRFDLKQWFWTNVLLSYYLKS